MAKPPLVQHAEEHHAAINDVVDHDAAGTGWLGRAQNDDVHVIFDHAVVGARGEIQIDDADIGRCLRINAHVGDGPDAFIGSAVAEAAAFISGITRGYFEFDFAFAGLGDARRACSKK